MERVSYFYVFSIYLSVEYLHNVAKEITIVQTVSTFIGSFRTTYRNIPNFPKADNR